MTNYEWLTISAVPDPNHLAWYIDKVTGDRFSLTVVLIVQHQYEVDNDGLRIDKGPVGGSRVAYRAVLVGEIDDYAGLDEENFVALTPVGQPPTKDEFLCAANRIATNARRVASMPADGVEALLARQVHWHRARGMLDAGVPLAHVIAETTDPEMLHALAEELPAYLRAHGVEPVKAQLIVPQVYDRLAAVARNTP